MNILPLVLGLIFVFSLLSATFLREKKLLDVVELSQMAAARIDREVKNTIEERRYKKVPTEAKHVSLTKKKAPFFSRRTINPPIAYSKLSLCPLFEKNIDWHNHPLYPVAERLLTLLYEHTPIAPRETGWEKRLLDALLTRASHLEDAAALTDLFPDDPELQPLYYKMLKGTNQYSLQENKGIPPLGDFITLEEEKPLHAIYFAFASPTLLNALLGDKIATEIVEREHTDWMLTGKHTLSTKQAFQEICLAHQINVAPLEAYINFSQKIPQKKEIAGKDQQTGMVVKRRC